MFVLTIDQHRSTGAQDRVPELLAALRAGAPAPRLAFERTAGDEVQGVLDDASEAIDAVRVTLRLGGWQTGLGIGPVDEPLPGSTRAASGPAFVRARDAVDRAKNRRLAVPVAVSDATGEDRGEGRAAADAEAVLQLLGTVVERRTARGWQAIDAVLGLGPEPAEGGLAVTAGLAARRRGSESRTRAQAAGMLGVTEQALSQRLQAAAWQQEKAVLPTLVRILEEADR